MLLAIPLAGLAIAALIECTGTERARATMLLLALLPATGLLPAWLQAHARVSLLFAAGLVLTWSMLHDTTPPTRLGVLARSTGAIDAWALALFAVAATTAVGYVVIGSRVAEISENDGAYYYGVARHIVRTGRFEEPIIWHFLHLPKHIVHAPFDYWGCMTSLVLVPALALFGATPRTAFLTMSVISAAALVAFWYLVCVALPLRYRITQLLALVLYAFSPAMAEYRFQPESIPVAQLFILLALIAFCLDRLVLALLFGFGILLTRGDGLILFALITLAVTVASARRRAFRARRIATCLLVAVACLATYVLWSVVSFGTLTPPGPQGLPLLDNYPQVLDYGVTRTPSLANLWRRFDWTYTLSHIELALLFLRWIPFTPFPQCWLAIAVVGGIGLLRRRRLAEASIWVFCFAGFIGLIWVAGPGVNFGRTPHTFTPLVILSGALGIDSILALLDRWVRRRERVAVPALLAGAGALSLCAVFLLGLPRLQVVPMAAQPTYDRLAQLDQVLRGESVASNVPWYIIAYTHSPAISIPSNGEAAIEDMLRRYDVHWLVLFATHLPWGKDEPRGIIKSVLSGGKTNLGRLTLERVPAPVSQAVFRVARE